MPKFADALENGLLFPGAELLTPYLFGRPLDAVFDYLPPDTVAWLVEPGRVFGEAERFSERIATEAAAAQAKPSFYPAPEAVYLRIEELEKSLSQMIAVEVGSLITCARPREGYALPIEIKCAAEPETRRRPVSARSTSQSPSSRWPPSSKRSARGRAGR